MSYSIFLFIQKYQLYKSSFNPSEIILWVRGATELDVGSEFRDRGSIPNECQRGVPKVT